MAIINRIRSVQGAGIFADRSAKDDGPVFRRLNLIYGFNGSGKSTLSRIFACLEAGKRHGELPSSCTFEIELDDGTIYGAPDSLGGLESRVCVFNTDFIERHLRWGEGRANSIFYISEEQGDTAAELKGKREKLPLREDAKKAQDQLVKAREKAVKTFRTERARLVANSLHLTSRRYEAGHLQSDYQKLPFDEKSVLTEEALNAFVEVARLADAPPPLTSLQDPSEALVGLVEAARRYAEVSIGQAALAEMERHPTMVPWLKAGNDYHTAHDLGACLFCGSELTPLRKQELAAALDNKLTELMAALRKGQGLIDAAREGLRQDGRWPAVAAIDPSLKADYGRTIDELKAALKAAEAVLDESRRIVDERLARPTVEVKHALPAKEAVAEVRALVSAAVAATNALIDAHNTIAADFTQRQEAAREAIRKHYLADGNAQYTALQADHASAIAEAEKLKSEVDDLNKSISELSEKVRTHGPAAGKITKLVQSYLGHGELTIFAADEGYELHRHDKIVRGPPSEGEKTAIALCYFISTLEADGREVKDLIVVVDDPISSLDSKALNYACCLIRSSLEGAAQLFVFTHNQNCMNEFKKAWKNSIKEKDGKPPTAALFYIDVSMPEQSNRRSAQIISMPPHLRGYDSEYHFLCSKALQFEAAGDGYSEYWFMMPNVIRRILEVFLGFKVPGSHNIQQKLEALAKELPDVDPIRIKALERLVQVESHSDSLDDLISHSSMTIEETREANSALLAIMAAADAGHTAAIRSQCKAA